MDRSISREDWEDHLKEDDARGRDINDLKLAMFGDPEKPDTVKGAVLPTMVRFNTLMDGAVMLVKGIGGLILFAGSAAALAKSLGWL
jgi:hypothetical protein